MSRAVVDCFCSHSARCSFIDMWDRHINVYNSNGLNGFDNELDSLLIIYMLTLWSLHGKMLISFLLFFSLSLSLSRRRKSMTGNWKANQGSAMLEQMPITEKYKNWIDEVSLLPLDGINFVVIYFYGNLKWE